MDGDRIFFIAARIEKHILPKIIHDGKMMFPIHLSYIIKDVTNFVIASYFFIEPVNQYGNIIPVLDIFFVHDKYWAVK
jgi:hypothetical protein